MHPQTNRFIVLYNNFEAALSEKLRKTKFEPFSLMVRMEAKRNRLIERNKGFLLDVADLRNVLVHTEDDMIMAIPSDEVLEKFEKLYNSYVKPMTVLDLCKGPAIILKPESSLKKALMIMKKNEISQLPVYDGKHFLGTMTSNTITRWMLDCIDNEGVLTQDLDDMTAEEMLDFSEDKDRAVFLERSKDVNELKMEVSGYDKPAAVFIITENGRNNESPLGVFTYGALAKIK